MSESARGRASSSSDATDKDASVECPTCGREDFASKKGMRQHHSIAHGESIAGDLVECEWCGDEMRVDPHRKERSNYLTCSKECSGKIQSKHYSGENHGSWNGGKVERECETCGDPVKVEKHRANKTEYNYCDEECRKKSNTHHASGEEHPNWDGGNNLVVECEICGTGIKTRECHNRRFCSRECADIWKETEFSGSGNPYWQGGYKRYYGPSWSEQRNKARKRDGYKCQYCTKAESEFENQHHVHHIIPFRRFDNHKKANSLSNLVTLCEDCHSKWEGLYLRPDVR